MRLNLIDFLVMGAVLAVLLLAARQDFPHFEPDTAASSEADQ